jgi:hypothetical protein
LRAEQFSAKGKKQKAKCKPAEAVTTWSQIAEQVQQLVKAETVVVAIAG